VQEANQRLQAGMRERGAVEARMEAMKREGAAFQVRLTGRGGAVCESERVFAGRGARKRARLEAMKREGAAFQVCLGGRSGDVFAPDGARWGVSISRGKV
jgi:hypothetical protein